MDDPGAVDGGERRRDADREALEVGAGQGPPLLDGLLQRRPVDELGDDVEGIAVEFGVQHGRGAEPADLPRRRHLAAEPLPERALAGQFPVDDLDGEPPAGAVLAEVDRPHAAAAEPAEQPVVAEFARVSVAQGLLGAQGLSVLTGMRGHRSVSCVRGFGSLPQHPSGLRCAVPSAVSGTAGVSLR